MCRCVTLDFPELKQTTFNFVHHPMQGGHLVEKFAFAIVSFVIRNDDTCSRQAEALQGTRQFNQHVVCLFVLVRESLREAHRDGTSHITHTHTHTHTIVNHFAANDEVESAAE